MLQHTTRYRYRPLTIMMVVLLCTLIVVHMYLSRPAPPPAVSDIALDLEPHSQKYITFLPHSGLQNQRLAYINAIILASETKRTLILPEVNLGGGAYWHPFDQLQDRVHQCPQYSHPAKVPGCVDYQNYVPRSVESVFDLSVLRELCVHTIQRPDMRPDYFERAFSIHENSSDIYRLKDTSRYAYQIHGSNTTSLDPKFSTRIDMDTLVDRNETLLFFGSLFGTHRLKLTRDHPLSVARRKLWQRMGPSNADVLKATEYVVGRLGGSRHFTSIHLRLGDGAFKDHATLTLAEMRQTLEQQQQQQQQQDGWNDVQDATVEKLTAIRDKREELLEACVKLQHQQQQQQQQQTNGSHRDPRPRLIYLATDIHPRELTEFSNRYICMFTLWDFGHQVKQIVHEPLLIPLVDAEVAAQAGRFVPTPNSTYSAYIHYRHGRFS